MTLRTFFIAFYGEKSRKLLIFATINNLIEFLTTINNNIEL